MNLYHQTQAAPAKTPKTKQVFKKSLKKIWKKITQNILYKKNLNKT
jgi:hypothetical protein